MKTRREILNKAKELAVIYEEKYKGCGQCTFLAIVGALRWGGIELIPEEMEKRIYPAVSMLTAGVCMTGEGTCGASASGVMAIGLALDIDMDCTNVDAARQAAATIRSTLLSKFFKKYGSILCKDVQRKYFGKAWNLADDEMAHEFLQITRGCIIEQTAELATRIILEIEKSKRTRDKVSCPSGI